MKLIDNPKGNYRFLTGIAPYSSGVVSMSGYEIVRVTLATPVPYRQGFTLIEQYLSDQNRSLAALCGLELRSPKAVTFEGFADLNRGYQDMLERGGLLVDQRNPIARTNVAPELNPPDEPVLFAFSYTVPRQDPAAPSTFVIAGAGDLIDQALKPQAIVRPDDTSIEAMTEKAGHVMAAMQSRLAGLQADWPQVSAVDIYTVHAVHPYLATTILETMGPAVGHGVHWYYTRPPLVGVEFEMDMRSIRQELRLD
jgi:hypothetical protein